MDDFFKKLVFFVCAGIFGIIALLLLVYTVVTAIVKLLQAVVAALIALFYAAITAVLIVIATLAVATVLISLFFSYRAKVRLTRLRVQMETEEWGVPEMNAELTRVRDQIGEVQRRMNRFPVLEYLQIRYLDTLREQEVTVKQAILRKGGRVASAIPKLWPRRVRASSPTLVLESNDELTEEFNESSHPSSSSSARVGRRQEPSVVDRRREFETLKAADLADIDKGRGYEELSRDEQEQCMRRANYWDQKIAKLYGD